MRPTACSAAVLGGLLALLLLPGVVSAHQITHVQVDCADKSILVSGESFGGDDGIAVTVTVSGPEGYVQTFVAEPRVPWTVSLPLGPSGAYTIRWPDPDGGSATFAVECPDESVPPATPSPSPSHPSQTPSPSPSEPVTTPSPSPTRPTATPSKTPDHHVTPSPQRTLPPTDTMAKATAVARTGTVLATLLFIAVFALAVALRRMAERRTRRR